MDSGNNVKKYAVVILTGIILNLGLYYIAHVCKLPVWMDSIGTAYVAVALEPAAGLIAAFINNFYQAAVIYDNSSLIYYMNSAVAALAFGIIVRKGGKVCWRNLAKAMAVYFVTATFLAGLLTIWRTSGVPDSGWERRFYEMALGWGAPVPAACFFGTGVLKVFDTCIMGILVPVLYGITPVKFKNVEFHDKVSWKNKYWN